jgi:DNA repair exonuclease SbcCD nuclease subunit
VQYRFSEDPAITALRAGPAPRYPDVRFAVISDPHMYDPSLGMEGAAFQQYMIDDRKLLSSGQEILSAAMQKIEAAAPRFLLISGDLTKDGEKQSHLLFARQLAELSAKGIKVYVVPGNHDILNPASVGYSEKGTTPVANITPAEFAEIYKDCGYGDALFRDPSSLSYVVEPVEGLWLLAVDSANYLDNPKKKEPVTGGGLTQARITWIETMLGNALRQRKAVIVMLHHGVAEHYNGNDKYYPDYLVNDWRDFSRMLAAYHARVEFTGHFHAQDITLARVPGSGFLYDIETGSLPTFPDPLRIVEISEKDQQMRVASSFIDELPSYKDKGIDFRTYSRDFIIKAGAAIGITTMRSLGVSQKDAQTLSPQVADALVAHFSGDEHFTGSVMLGAPGLGLMGNLVVSLRKGQVESLWNDLEPPDNDLDIDLSTGTWSTD